MTLTENSKTVSTIMIYIVSSFNIFDPKKISEDCYSYSDASIQTLIQCYGKKGPAESVMGEKFMMPALVKSDLLTERKVFQKYST